jgi:RimJ/RimL family protein N-acetyltransferase
VTPLHPRGFSTERLDLRPVTPDDRGHLVALEADPEVMRFLNGGQPVPEAGCPDADFLTPRGTEPEVLVAHERGTGRFIGWFALFDDGLVDGLRTAEVGYRLHRTAWGQGYATEGLVALLAQAFEPLGFDRIRARTMAVNLGSRRVLEKAGFRPIDTVRAAFVHPLPGSEAGELVYERRRHTDLRPATP